MEIHHLAGSAWTTYIPSEWTRRFQKFHEYPYVSAIVATPDNAVWFATEGGPVAAGAGAYRFDGKTWLHFQVDNGFPFDEMSSMAVARDGAIWLGSFCCGAARFDGKAWTTYTTADGLASDDVRSVALAPDGALWFGTMGRGLSRFDGTSWQTFTTRDGLHGNFVGRISVLRDGSLLVSSTMEGSPDMDSSTGLSRFDSQHWANFATPWSGADKYVMDMVALPNGELWLATERAGVYHFAQNAWRCYSKQTGLASDNTLCSVVAQDGAVWFGTWAGLSRFDGQTWTTFNSSDDVGANWVSACAAAPDGSLWFGYTGGIAQYVPTASSPP